MSSELDEREVLKTRDGAFTVEVGGMETVSVDVPDDPGVASIQVRVKSAYEPHTNSQIDLVLDLDYATWAKIVAQGNEIINPQMTESGKGSSEGANDI